MYANHSKIKADLEKLVQHSGVKLAILADEKGFPLSSTCETSEAEKFSALLTSLKQRINLVLQELGLGVANHVQFHTASQELLITTTDASNLIVVRKKE